MFDGGLSILARRDSLTESDWLELLEQRRKLFLSCARDMSLDALSDVRTSETLSEYIHSDQTRIACSDGLTHHTRGLYASGRARSNYSSSVQSWTEKFWGLSRNGEWMLIVLHWFRDDLERRLVRVDITKTTPSELCKVLDTNPCAIWQWIGRELLAWKTFREDSLRLAQTIASAVEAEDALFGCVLSKSAKEAA